MVTTTKDNPADLINVALEEPARARRELPGFSALGPDSRGDPDGDEHRDTVVDPVVPVVGRGVGPRGQRVLPRPGAP